MRQYLFPFNEVNKNSKIVIYGGGEIGVRYIEQIKQLSYCDCLFVVDRNFSKIQPIMGIEVFSPQKLINCEYDKVIIASTISNDEIYQLLIDLNISSEKIVRNVCVYEMERDPFLETPNPENGMAWDYYYDAAENGAKKQFESYLKPILSRYEDICLDKVLDFACGHGRMANIFSTISKQITCCDVNSLAIEYCRDRFLGNTNCLFKFVNNQVNDNSLECLSLETDSFSFIYSWDAMVHFSYKWMDFYLKEFYRILIDGSYAIIHHSNYANASEGVISENWKDNPSWRGYTSREDIKFIAQNHGFTVLDQEVIDWNFPKLDCISVLRKI